MKLYAIFFSHNPSYVILFALMLTPCLVISAEFIHAQQGTIPILLTAPHGGRLDVPHCKERTHGLLHADINTLILMVTIGEQLSHAGYVPYIVGLSCKRKYVDVNRPRENAYEDTQAEAIYNAYHAHISTYITEINKKFPHKSPLLIDIHGQGTDAKTIFRGTQDKKTVQRMLSVCGEDALTGAESILGYLYRKGYEIYPSILTVDQQEHPSYNGGFTVFSYGSHEQSGIDAIQLEIGSHVRTRENILTAAEALASAIATFHKKWQQ